MRRREVIGLLGGAAAAIAASHAARAQQPRRIGVLMASSVNSQDTAAFEQVLRSLGWRPGQGLQIDYHGRSEGDRVHADAANLVASAPDLIVANTTSVLAAVKQATRTIPIVFTGVSDPVAQGFVPNLTHPGGNITGFAAYEFSIGGKWLDLLKQIKPDLARAALLSNPETSPQSKFFMESIAAAAPALGVEAMAAPVRREDEIEPRIAEVARQPNAGLILGNDQFLNGRRDQVVRLAARFRLPAIYAQREFVEAGGLMRYGSFVAEQWRGAAIYADRILKGAKPGDLPVQQPTKFELVINARVARELGLELPMGLMLRADEVIE